MKKIRIMTITVMTSSTGYLNAVLERMTGIFAGDPKSHIEISLAAETEV